MFDPLNKDQNSEIATPEIINQTTQTLVNDIATILKSLEIEEKELLEEQANLITIQETLSNRIKEEIGVKEAKISELKQAIPTLKQNCEKMANALGIKTQK